MFVAREDFLCIFVACLSNHELTKL